MISYKPASVFKKFSFVHLLDELEPCACNTATRLRKFCDPLTKNEHSSFGKPSCHVRSMDLDLIQHPGLRVALKQGLNHIVLRPTNIAQAVATMLDAFEQLIPILHLDSIQFPISEARAHLHNLCLHTLKAANHSNKYGFRQSGQFLLEQPAVRNEIQWLTKHLYCAGLDKAANNACFMCIKHIRLQALERLMGTDFSPCKVNGLWTLPTSILDFVKEQLLSLLPECPPIYDALPYLMATYKLHKTKYRWLTNAYQTVFSNIAILLTLTSNLILESIKIWAKTTEKGLKNFMQVDTSFYSIIDSVLDATLNLPEKIHDILVADITRCYESIPLQGPDNLLLAVSFIIKLAFKQAATLHPRAVTQLWVRIDINGIPCNAKWASSRPSAANWFPISSTRLLSMHDWLMSHCFVTLGDRMWRQSTGIPMGFSCSPVWCNIYLLSYEVQFIQRLAKLGCRDLLLKFQNPFHYIDDLCLINVQNPRSFLSPAQPRHEDNPFWIYPLNILDIKEKTVAFSLSDPQRGLVAHFMNVEIFAHETIPEAYMFQKYDKRRALPFQYTQYIKFSSNRPVRQAYNICISQVLPILYLSNTNEAAIREIRCLIHTMCRNGFKQSRLISTICQFLENGPFPASHVQIEQIIIALSIDLNNLMNNQ
jgi:hypothetical protein